MTRILEIIGSRRLAVALMFALVGACAAGTLVPLEKGVEYVYHAPWFLLIVLAFSINTIACTALEISKRKVPVGFIFIHAGTLVLLAGGAVGISQSVKGRVAIEVGQSSSSFEKNWKGLDDLRLSTGESFRGQFLGIQAGMPGAEHGSEDGGASRRTAVFAPMGKRAIFVHVEELESVRVEQARPGREFETDILRRLESARPEEVFVESCTASAVRVRKASEPDGAVFEVPHQEIMILRMGSPATAPLGFSVRLDDFRILYHESTVQEIVRVQAPGQAPVFLAPEPGPDADIGGGFKARVSRYLPDAVMDRETKKVESRSGLKVNPAAEVEITWEGGVETRWAFRETMPGFHMKRHPSGVTVEFESSEGMPKAYISNVSIVEEGRVVERAAIEVNAPFTYGGYTLFQDSWGTSGANYVSYFSVHRDPGLGAVYTGFLLLMIGCLETFYLRPLLAARRKARNRRAPDAAPAAPEGGA